MCDFPRINIKKTGIHLRRLCIEQGYSVRKLQSCLQLASNQAIYNWFNGNCLPAVDNLAALSVLLDCSIDDLLIIEK